MLLVHLKSKSKTSVWTVSFLDCTGREREKCTYQMRPVLQQSFLELVRRRATQVPHDTPDPPFLLCCLSDVPPDLVSDDSKAFFGLVDLGEEPLKEDTGQAVLAQPAKVPSDRLCVPG